MVAFLAAVTVVTAVVVITVAVADAVVAGTFFVHHHSVFGFLE